MRSEPTDVPKLRHPVSSDHGRHSPESPHAWLRRYRALRTKFVLALTCVGLVVGLVAWLANRLFSIDPGKGTPCGLVVRTDRCLATWIQTLEPYIPTLNRRGGDDRFTLSVLVVPLDGSAPRVVPVHHGLEPGRANLARVLGSHGDTLFVEAVGVSGIDLGNFAVRAHVGPLPDGLTGAPVSRTRPSVLDHLAGGYFLGDRHWLGLLSPREVERDYGPRKFVRRIVHAADQREARRFHRATLEPDSSGQWFGVVGVASIGAAEFANAAFLRPARDAEPFRLRDPDGALMVFSSDLGPGATLVVARTDDEGGVRFRVDTGLDRFALQQILPGAASTAFVGARPRVPDHVPEPLLVLVEHATGRVVAHSLWR